MSGWLMLVGLLAASLTGYPVVVDVAPTGDALVNVSVVVVDAPIVLNVTVIGEPYVYTAYDSGGSELPVNYTDDVFSVLVPYNTTVTIEYVSAVAVKNGKLWTINFTSGYPVEVVLPDGAVPVRIEPEPQSMVLVNGSRVALFFEAGRVVIEYGVIPPVHTGTPTPAPTATETVTGTGTPPPPAPTSPAPPLPEYSGGERGWELIALASGSVLAAGLAVAGLIWRRGRGSSGDNPDIDERDREILEAIRRLGGSATAQEIQEATGIPKTPLYRRLQRLVKYGLLEEIPGRRRKYRLKTG